MPYLVSDVVDVLRKTLSKNSDVRLSVTFGMDTPHEATIVRRRSWTKNSGGTIDVWASVDNSRVVFDVIEGPSVNRVPHGMRSATEAASAVLDFILSDDDGPLLRVHARYGRRPVVHDLKCWPEFFGPLITHVRVPEGRVPESLRKQFEYRKNDRDFQEGDVLYLREWRPPVPESGADGKYTGNTAKRLVTYVLRGPDAGLPASHCVMSLTPLP